MLLLLRLSQLTVRVRACRRSSFARRRDDRAIYCILLFDFEWFPLAFSFSGASRRRWREKWVPGRPSRLATTELQAWSAAVCRLLQPGGTTAFGVCALPGAADVTPSISRRRRRRRRCCEYRGVRMPRRAVRWKTWGEKKNSFGFIVFTVYRINVNILKPLAGTSVVYRVIFPTVLNTGVFNRLNCNFFSNLFLISFFFMLTSGYTVTVQTSFRQMGKH